MYLSEFRIFNYKSFLDSGPIKLKPGFNVLTGQNNAGKTALLEAIGLRFSNKPHRSLGNEPSAGSASTSQSNAFLRVSMTQTELKERQRSRTSMVVPIVKADFPDTSDATRLWSAVLAGPEIQLDFYRQQNGPLVSGWRHKGSAAESVYTLLDIGNSPDGESCSIIRLPDFRGRARDDYLQALSSKDVSSEAARGFYSSIYSFRAERMNIGLSPFGSDVELRPDASNLPEVLNVLQSTNPARFQRYNGLVRRVFPQVELITVRPVASNQVEILVWPVDPKTERADLAVPLSESGTGISQVLAMLYVLVTADTPRTIIIDEPNSFLHPGAVRVLVEILREHPRHQYIISTHSPELIAASNPSTVHLLRRTQGITQVESVDTQEARHLRTLLLEVGSRLSDVFGAESVLWVEGPTEQLCFPLIVQQHLRRPLAGVSIVGVLHTGDFDAKKDTRSVFRIYERLTQQGSALLPPAIAFIFDREIRPDKDREDLERESKGRVHFLGRRTYENYLLHSGAIAAILNECPPFTEAPTTAEKVQTWLTAHIHQPEYYGKAKTRNYPQDIDAPKLLDDLFNQLSENRLSYNKVEHSLALTEWLLEHASEELKELAELLGEVLPRPA